ncbi:cytochrome c [Beijerinckia sp. L45]|uniref:cytochrome c n=1 Tax=Beijerinckia sp. L45 TaxID=1641855 RepID=UPI00131AC135|nr:cytochrome c [Beijerinckia sp. L45]
MSRMRNGLLGLSALVVVGVVAVAAVALHKPEPQISDALAQRKPDVTRGAYVAVLGDCVACHTSKDGKPFAGGVPFETPVGTVYSSNITPDKDTGIGTYTFPDFVRLMRFGVTPSGGRVYPAMPYTAYAKVSDEDLQDLFAYMQHGVTAENAPSRKDGMTWPLSMRWPLALWNIAFHDDSRFVPDVPKDTAWNRGAYLVQGLTHCGTCHTPRGIALQEKDVNGTSNLFLSGSVLDGSSPINLRGNIGDGLGRWSVGDIAEVLKTGVNIHSAIAGPMAEVVEHSTQYMSDDDVKAVAIYLKTLPPAPDEGRATFAASDATIKTVLAGKETSPGGRMFMDSCAACHRESGKGETLAFPKLAGNPSVLSADPSSLIAIILNGARLPSTAGAPTGLAMPPFGWRYGDADVAQLASFVRASWGNGASAVTADEVSKVRARVEPSRAKAQPLAASTDRVTAGAGSR